MLSSYDVAKYFLSLDPDRILFNKKVISRNGRDFYEGNARLNKYLHLAQNLYIAKTGHKLFNSDLYAYDNGAVVLEIQKNYPVLIDRHDAPLIADDTALFLKKVFRALQNASIDELIDISHEDSEWLAKHNGYYNSEQLMDSVSRADEYREQYKDMLRILDRMN